MSINSNKCRLALYHQIHRKIVDERCCLCLDEIYISLVLETFNDMLFELHQDKTFCKPVVKVSTNVSIEWLDVPIVVSSEQVLVSERGRSFT